MFISKKGGKKEDSLGLYEFDFNIRIFFELNDVKTENTYSKLERNF